MLLTTPMRGIVNIVDVRTRYVDARTFPGRESGSDAPLGASVVTFSPDGAKVAVSTSGRILFFDARTKFQIGTGVEIPGAGNLAFTRSPRGGYYVASAVRNSVYFVPGGDDRVIVQP